MKGQFCFLILLGILTFCRSNPTSTQSLNTNELEAKEFVRVANIKLNNLYEELRLQGYQVEIKTANQTLESVTTKLKNISKALAELVFESKQFDSSQFKDDELKYVFEIINLEADDAILGDWFFGMITKAVADLEAMATNKNIAQFRKTNVQLAYDPDIQNIIAYTNNTDVLKYYWKEWRKFNTDCVLKNIVIIEEGILEAANVTGISALEYWMKGFNITDMERIMNETEPFYLQLHAFVRLQLKKKYGGWELRSDGTIPDHLFRQFLVQTWTNASLIEEMFPLAQLPAYNNIFKQNNYDASQLYKSADRFYKSLGFDSLPENYWGSDIMMSKYIDEDDCETSIYDLNPNIYLFYCDKIDFYTYLQAHRYMGQIYYAREKTNLPSYFLGTHNLEDPIGEAVVLSASTFNHLKTIGLLNNFEVTEEIKMHRLLRIALQSLFNIRQQFVHSKVMADFFAGKVELGHLNRHYWKLMVQYVGVGPAVDRVHTAFDFPETFYFDVDENGQAKEFNSAILGYQFYKKFCQISGKYPNDDLNSCDFFGSKDVGDALKKMMKLGSSKRKSQVLETLFPENPTISSDGLLEYYSPLNDWLTQKNKVAKAKLGWILPKKVVKRVKFHSGEDYDDDGDVGWLYPEKKRSK